MSSRRAQRTPSALVTSGSGASRVKTLNTKANELASKAYRVVAGGDDRGDRWSNPRLIPQERTGPRPTKSRWDQKEDRTSDAAKSQVTCLNRSNRPAVGATCVTLTASVNLAPFSQGLKAKREGAKSQILHDFKTHANPFEDDGVIETESKAIVLSIENLPEKERGAAITYDQTKNAGLEREKAFLSLLLCSVGVLTRGQ